MLEKMDEFFNARAKTYDSHMLDDLKLDEFYESIATCFEAPISRMLDLGCGTGLELTRLFDNNPDVQIVGVDMSNAMLEELRHKFPDKSMELICASYFETEFGGGFDAVLSTYSLHHFSETEKLGLYAKIRAAIKPGGRFVFGDYTVSNQERQDELLDENRFIRLENKVPDGEFYHFDTPFTAGNEIRLMTSAGFKNVRIVRWWENTSIIIAEV